MTDNQYKANMKTAMATMKMTEKEVLHLVTRPNMPIVKFRLEPGQFNSKKWSRFTPFARFYICSSFGLGQVMGFNLIGPIKYKGKDIPLFDNLPKIMLDFAYDEKAQVEWTAKEFEKLLAAASNDKKVQTQFNLSDLTFHAYCQYNSGNRHSTDPAVIKRAKEVVSRI